nr:MAG TPA: hypothetical protein [Caudoviricetes sp.]
MQNISGKRSKFYNQVKFCGMGNVLRNLTGTSQK